MITLGTLEESERGADDPCDFVTRTGDHRNPLVKGRGLDREDVLSSVGAPARGLAHEKGHGVGLVEKS